MHTQVWLIHIYNVLPEVYPNESGTIDMRQLQFILDEISGNGIFKRQYADLNWYEGKYRMQCKGDGKWLKLVTISLLMLA